MTIDEEFASGGIALPKAYWALQEAELTVPVFAEQHGMRHPKGTYSISLGRIGRRINDVCEAMRPATEATAHRGPEASRRQKALIDATDHLLDALVEHFDACSNVLTAYCASSDDARLRNAKAIFKSGTSVYRAHVGRLVNFLKHSQGAVMPITLDSALGSTLGYFVEGPVPGGGLGPSPVVHPGGNSAFSYNRDLRLHVCGIFNVGAVLATALHSLDRRFRVGDRTAVENEWTKAVVAVAELHPIFFPDEPTKPVPAVIFTRDGRVKVQYPSKLIKPQAPQRWRAEVAYQGDGITRMFKVPYMGRDV